MNNRITCQPLPVGPLGGRDSIMQVSPGRPRVSSAKPLLEAFDYP